MPNVNTGAPAALTWDLLQEIAVLRAGRSPVVGPHQIDGGAAATGAWVFEGATPAPTLATDGIDTRDKISALMGVRLRQSAAVRRAWLRVDNADVGELYGCAFGAGSDIHDTKTVAGVAGDPAATVAALKALLDADADFANWQGTASLVAGQANVLLYEFGTPTPIFINAATQAVSPFQSLAAEASQCVWRVWGMPIGTTLWAPLLDLTFGTFDTPVDLRPIDCRGFDRLYLQVVRADGAVLPLQGVRVRDDRRDTALTDSAALLEQADDTDLFSFPATLTGNVMDLLSVAETRPDFATDGFTWVGVDVEGVDTITAGFGRPVFIATYDVEAWHLLDAEWQRLEGGVFTGLTEAWAEQFDVRRARRFYLRLLTLPAGQLQRTYREIGRGDRANARAL